MSERDEVKRDGAKAQKNSGRGKHDKGDAVLEPFLIDYKEYEKSFAVNTTVWGKICTDAIRAGGYEPTLKIILGKDNNKVRVYVISETMFNEMREAWLEKYGEASER